MVSVRSEVRHPYGRQNDVELTAYIIRNMTTYDADLYLSNSVVIDYLH